MIGDMLDWTRTNEHAARGETVWDFDHVVGREPCEVSVVP
jgi:hypothetical protein